MEEYRPSNNSASADSADARKQEQRRRSRECMQRLRARRKLARARRTLAEAAEHEEISLNDRPAAPDAAKPSKVALLKVLLILKERGPGAADDEDVRALLLDLSEEDRGTFDRILAARLDEFEGERKPAFAAEMAAEHLKQAAGAGAVAPQQKRPAPIHDWDNPDYSILDDRRGDLPEFPVDVLIAPWQALVEREAHGAGTTVAHVAVPLLGIASSLIGTSRRIMPSRSWTQPMTTWTAIVGFSGTGKTPGIDVTKRAVSKIERNASSKIAELRRAHEGSVEAAKTARAQWKKEVEKATEGSVVSLDKYRSTAKAMPVMPVEAVDPGPFVAPRLYVSDVTIERLAVLLQARAQGMLLISDELAGLFLNMSRYSGGSDREFWLEAWNGGRYTVERMGRSPITAEHLLVGVTGGLQPDKLARSFSGDLDGMYARVLFAWPSEPAYQKLTDEVAEDEPQIVNALQRLSDLSGGKDEDGGFAPRAIRLSSDAREVFELFRRFQNTEKESLDGREREWWAKTPAHVLRLAGTLSYLGWSMNGGPEPEYIDAEFIAAAIQLVREFFWPHSRAALRQIGLSERHGNARRVLRWLMGWPGRAQRPNLLD